MHNKDDKDDDSPVEVVLNRSLLDFIMVRCPELRVFRMPDAGEEEPPTYAIVVRFGVN